MPLASQAWGCLWLEVRKDRLERAAFGERAQMRVAHDLTHLSVWRAHVVARGSLVHVCDSGALHLARARVLQHATLALPHAPQVPALASFMNSLYQCKYKEFFSVGGSPMRLALAGVVAQAARRFFLCTARVLLAADRASLLRASCATLCAGSYPHCMQFHT